MQDYFLSLLQSRKRGPWAAVQRAGLWIASLPYGAAMHIRNRAYDLGWKKTHRVNVSVIGVGNLTVGGTGKTPCVEYLARCCRLQGKRVAILSRGYGGRAGPNDEALLLEENLPDVPHLQHANRVSLAHMAEEKLKSEVLILDDGFQHRRLARDLDVLLIDATSPWGYGHLLPRGLLREPAAGLRRANLVLLTRCDQVEYGAVEQIRKKVRRFAPEIPVVSTIHRPVELVNAEKEVRVLEEIAARPVAGFCGIANPEAFRKSLIGQGGEICAFRTYPDHHSYSKADIDDLHCWARQQAKDCVIVTTQKDLVKIRLSRLGERSLWALRIQLHVTAGQELLDRKLKEALA